MTIDIGPNLASTIENVLGILVILMLLSVFPILCWRNRED